MSKPLVSVIIAAYNADLYIEKAVDSVLNQTYENIELIVVNDGSTDGTKEILQAYNNIKLINQNNQGQDNSFNRGFQESNGKYIKFFDADDILSVNHIELQIKALENKPNSIAYSEWDRFFNNDVTLCTFPHRKYYKSMLPIDFICSDIAGPMLQCGTMLVPRSIIERAGLWSPELILFNDTEFFIRMILASSGVEFVPGAKLFYRSGVQNSLTSQKNKKLFISTFKAISMIEKQLLEKENSERTKKLLANMYQMRLYDMYPNYKDLRFMYEQRIIDLGGTNYVVKSGFIYNVLNFLFGWKMTKRIKISINNFLN